MRQTAATQTPKLENIHYSPHKLAVQIQTTAAYDDNDEIDISILAATDETLEQYRPAMLDGMLVGRKLGKRGPGMAVCRPLIQVRPAMALECVRHVKPRHANILNW
jgi:hypothetical protein